MSSVTVLAPGSVAGTTERRVGLVYLAIGAYAVRPVFGLYRNGTSATATLRLRPASGADVTTWTSTAEPALLAASQISVGASGLYELWALTDDATSAASALLQGAFVDAGTGASPAAGYAAELDDLRFEVRRGSSGTIRFWPKLPGSGNVEISADPTYTVLDPRGSTVGSGTGARASFAGVTRVTCAIDASGLALGEDYAAVITWTDPDAETHVETVRFDVVTEPYVPSISLNDLVDQVADASARLSTMAASQADGRTAAQMASVLGVVAWREIRRWLRRKAEQDGRTYPQMIINAEELRDVITLKTIAIMFDADGAPPGSPTRELAELYHKRAREAFDSAPMLRYSDAQDRVEDARLSSYGVVTVRRTRT
jgi:hypothetical protein